jgi:hypothetical protein
MRDVAEMIRADLAAAETVREQFRAEFPGGAAIGDGFREKFGPGVKLKWVEEDGKTMGKQQPFDGTDVDKLIRLSDMDAKRRGGR